MAQRPGTSSGRPFTSSGRPPTSSGPFRGQFSADSTFDDHDHPTIPSGVPYSAPSTGYGPSEYSQEPVFGHYPPDALYEEDEDEDESSDDGDVFAYLPPSTAEQQLEEEQSQPAHPPQSSGSTPFQYSPSNLGSFAHSDPEGDPRPPQYPGTDTSPFYPTLNTALTQSTDYSNNIPASLHRSPSHPPSALLQPRNPQPASPQIPIVSVPLNSPYIPHHPNT